MYREQFRIPDGGEIAVINAAGEQDEFVCRYIDDYHVEVGSNIFHICEFAEFLERGGSTCTPITTSK
jgi:hypothetical protein